MRHSILMVDDSEDTRELFQAALEADGFDVVTAGDGQQALAILRDKQDFSMILLDVAMPGMSGLEVLEQMQAEGLAKKTPIMLVTALKDLKAPNLPPNVTGTLEKPFFFPELTYKIKQELGILPKSS
jgi:CheY-like chemotaxis protein